MRFLTKSERWAFKNCSSLLCSVDVLIGNATSIFDDLIILDAQPLCELG